MSRVALTNAERIAALRRFGYSESEASFLCLAALHGGYFLRRQYTDFLHRQDGGSVSQLIRRALTRGHVRTSTWHQNTQLYHLCARPFYEALGEGDNRNRRARALLTIKNKIMSLDFVVAHPRHRYLATEREKLGYFSGDLKLDLSVLPAKIYPSRRSGENTARYFVEKHPMFLAGPTPEGAPPAVTFCIVDEGAASLSGFETFLTDYNELFAALDGFQVVYVAATPAWFQPAEQAFARFVGQARTGVPDPLIRRRLEYFKMRRLFEGRDLSSFDRTKLIRLRREQQEFSSQTDEALYARWKRDGDRAVIEILAPEIMQGTVMRGTFSTYLLEHDYGLFGRFPG